MASKKEIFTQVVAVLEKHKASKELIAEISAIVEPKKGGMSVNVEDVYVPKAKDGKAYLLCSVSGLWLEATADNFYEDASEGNKFGGLKRLSRAAEAARKKAISVKKATEAAVMQDMLAGNISADEAKAKLAKVAGPDFSQIKGLKVKPQ